MTECTTNHTAAVPVQTILVVDDTPENLAVMGDLLHADYRVRAAKSGAHALRIARVAPAPDLILLDVMMPEMDGYEVLKQLREDPGTRDIPVIFITALNASEDEELGLRLGAVDYIAKPIKPAILRARVGTHLELKRARDRLQDQNTWLEAEVGQRMRENDLIQLVSIRTLAHLAEIRDPETGNHILRTQGYVELLATRLRDHPRYRDTLSTHHVELLVRSAPLHDIGKVGVPDAILQKPGRLDAEEWTIMRSHAYLGAQAIEQAKRDAEQPVEFLDVAMEIAHWHHEKWDGSGYPDGLAGDAIPVSARVMALADVFDALISARTYKPAMSFEKAREILSAGRGSHFDPDMADVFLAHYDQFVAIAKRHGDHDNNPQGTP